MTHTFILIAILPEGFIYTLCIQFLTSHSLINLLQYGVHPNHSTEIAFINVAKSN